MWKTRTFIFVALALLVATAANAGEIGYSSGESCTVTADLVSCTPTAGRGSLVIEASDVAFVKLRDALTPSWDGNLSCTSCHVASGVIGCTLVGDVVAMSRKSAALANLTCQLRSLVVQQDRKDARSSADSGVDTDPDIGGGDPG
jgi:hypothetical protein